MTAFAHIKVGQQFIYNGQTWVKTTPVKASCCTLKKNAHLVSNPATIKVFKPTDQVQKVEV